MPDRRGVGLVAGRLDPGCPLQFVAGFPRQRHYAGGFRWIAPRRVAKEIQGAGKTDALRCLGMGRGLVLPLVVHQVAGKLFETAATGEFRNHRRWPACEDRPPAPARRPRWPFAGNPKMRRTALAPD